MAGANKPQAESGRYPTNRIVGEPVTVEAAVFAAVFVGGHDQMVNQQGQTRAL